MESLVGMEDLFSGTYKGKTVLVTGHTGFKGTWLTLWLQSLGTRVIGYALPPNTEPSLFHLAGLEGGIDHYIGDVRDLSTLQNVLQTSRPEMIFHLAAQSLVRPSYSSPVETYATNVMGTVHLLEAIRRTPTVRVCVIVTSDKCYENREGIYAYRESDPMGGNDPYSSSKGCSELVTAAYRRSFFSGPIPVAIASVRAGNVIGGGDWAEDRILPDCIRALTQQRPIPIRNPDAIRPWQHVLEPLSGYLWLGACLWNVPGRFEESWNFGPHEARNITVRDLVERVVALWGEGTWEDLSKRDNPPLYEMRSLMLDMSKANYLLGWQPVYTLSDTLAETVLWYAEQNHNPSCNIRAYTMGQIRKYVQMAYSKGAIWTRKADGK